MAVPIDKSISRRERRKLETRERIINAGISLFAEKGYDSTTVEDIYDTADVAKKTFYNYFETKQDLVNEIAQELLIEEAVNAINMAIECSDNTKERLQFFFQRMKEPFGHLDGSTRDRELFIRLVVEIASNIVSSGPYLDQLNSAFTKLFEACKKSKGLRKGLQPDFLAEMVVSTMNGIILNWVHHPDYPAFKRTQQLEKYLYSTVIKED